MVKEETTLILSLHIKKPKIKKKIEKRKLYFHVEVSIGKRGKNKFVLVLSNQVEKIRLYM